MSSDLPLRLEAEDGKTAELPAELAAQCTRADEEAKTDGEVRTVRVVRATGATVQAVKRFCQLDAEGSRAVIPQPLWLSDLPALMPASRAAIVDVGVDDLVNLTLAARQLGIAALEELCVAKLAAMIKDKTSQEIGEMFNIEAGPDSPVLEAHPWVRDVASIADDE